MSYTIQAMPSTDEAKSAPILLSFNQSVPSRQLQGQLDYEMYENPDAGRK